MIIRIVNNNDGKNNDDNVAGCLSITVIIRFTLYKYLYHYLYTFSLTSYITINHRATTSNLEWLKVEEEQAKRRKNKTERKTISERALLKYLHELLLLLSSCEKTCANILAPVHSAFLGLLLSKTALVILQKT